MFDSWPRRFLLFLFCSLHLHTARWRDADRGTIITGNGRNEKMIKRNFRRLVCSKYKLIFTRAKRQLGIKIDDGACRGRILRTLCG